MKIIRCGTFETNSSSTHAIVVPKKVTNETWNMSDSLYHNYEFGRQESRLVDDWDEKLAYAYMIVKNFKEWTDGGRNISITQKTVDEFKERVNKIYKDVEQLVEYKPYDDDPKPNDIFRYIDSDGETSLGNISFILLGGYSKPYPFVDHCESFDTNGFLKKILTDDEFLKRFIFNNKSYITVGGDEHRGYNIKTIGFEYDYDEYYVNEKGERPPKEWFDDNGCIKDEYWDKYNEEYSVKGGDFWSKLKEYEKENDVFLKGN